MLEDGNDRLEGNHRSRHNLLVLSVAVCVDTELLRDPLAHSHWCLLVDLMADLLGNILSPRIDN